MGREELLEQIQRLATNIEMACDAAVDGDQDAQDQIETDIARMNGLAIDLKDAQPGRNHNA